MALLAKNGYGQVEFNKVTSQVTKDIIVKLPVADTITQVEMGMFLVPDYTNGVMTLPAAKGAAAYLVNNEIKNYDERNSRKDFVLTKFNGNKYAVSQGIYPRCFKMSVGDIFHTNLIEDITDTSKAGDTYAVDTTGHLVKVTDIANFSMAFGLEKVSTMPDGQKAAKLVCIKANY